MLINKVRRVAPTLAGVARAKAIVLKGWQDYADTVGAHQLMWIWRYPTLTDATNLTNGVFIDKTAGNKYRDENDDGTPLALNETAYYRIQSEDKWGNLSYFSAVLPITFTGTNTNELVGTIGSAQISDGAIKEVKLDLGLPNAVAAAPTLTSLTADIDGDGTPDLGFTIAWAAPAVDATHPAARLYEVEIWRKSTDKGTDGSITGYTLWRSFTTPNLSLMVEAKRKFFHKARVRGLSFASQSGNNWSAYTNVGIQPNKYDVLSGSTPAAPTAVAVANGIYVSWTQPTDPTYLETRLYQGATLIVTTSASGFLDQTVRTLGTGYTYTVVHYDRAGFFTNSSAASNSATYRAATSNEIGTNAITPRQLQQADFSNLFLNPQADGGSTAGWEGGAPVTPVAKAGSTTPVSTIPTAFAFSVPSTSGAADYVGVNWMNVKEGDVFHYEFDYAAAAGTTGIINPMIRRTDTTGATAPTALANLNPSTTWQTFAGSFTVPAGCVKIFAGIRTASGGAGTWYLTNFRFTRRVSSELVDTGAILAANLGTGLGGNMLPNSDLAAGFVHWGLEYTNGSGSFTTALRTDVYAPHPGSLEVRQTSAAASLEYGIGPKAADGSVLYFSVEAGAWYELSTYFLGHRCNGIQPYIRWEDSTNTLVSHSSLGIFPAYQDINPGKSLASYARAWGKAQAPAGAVRAAVFFRHMGTRQGFSYTDSYLWLHKMFFGKALANQSEPSPWSPAPVGVVTQAITDQTQPAALTAAPVAVQSNQDVDGDGKTDIAIKWTWTKPTDNSNPVVAYQVAIYENAVLIDSFQTALTTVTRKVKTRVNISGSMVASSYYATVQTVGFNGKVSGLGSGTSNTVSPVKKSAVLAGTFAVSGFAGVGLPIANKLNWTPCTEPDYLETRVYRYTTLALANAATLLVPGGTQVGQISGNEFTDQFETDLIGTPFWYRVQHFDRSGNPGTLSSVKSLTVKGNLAKDLTLPDGTNLMGDPNCEDMTAWIVNNAGEVANGGLGLVRQINKYGSGSTSEAGYSKYRIKVGGVGAELRSPYVMVESGEYYLATVWLGPATEGVSTTITAYIQNFVFDANNDPTGQFSLGSLTKTVTTMTKFEILFQAYGPRIKFEFYTDASAGYKEFAMASPIVRKRPSLRELPQLTQKNSQFNNPAVGSWNTGNQLLASTTADHGIEASAVLVIGQFRNVSGAAKTFSSITLFNGVGVGRTHNSVTLGDKEVHTIVCVFNNPDGATTNFFLRAQGATNGNDAAERSIDCISFRS